MKMEPSDARRFIQQHPPSQATLKLYLPEVKAILRSNSPTVTKVANIRILTDTFASPRNPLNWLNENREGVSFRIATFQCIQSFFKDKLKPDVKPDENDTELLKLALKQVLSDGHKGDINQSLGLLSFWTPTPQIKHFEELLKLRKIVATSDLANYISLQDVVSSREPR